MAEPVITLTGIISEVAEVAGFLWQRGWAERNAGNISVCLKDVPKSDLPAHYQHTDIALPEKANDLAGMSFFITATNSRMRDLARKPMENALIIRITEDGQAYNIISHIGPTALRPSSELASHLAIHSLVIRRGSSHRVVLHTHARELIALTQIKELCDEEKLNRLLWGMHPETKLLVPGGVGFVPYFVPGTTALGEATVKALENHDVALWEKHGVFAVGATPNETFDLIDILTRSASIYFMCRSAGKEPDGLTDSQIDELGRIKF